MTQIYRISSIAFSLLTILLLVSPVTAAPSPAIQVIFQSVESHFPDDLTFMIDDQLGIVNDLTAQIRNLIQ